MAFIVQILVAALVAFVDLFLFPEIQLRFRALPKCPFKKGQKKGNYHHGRLLLLAGLILDIFARGIAYRQANPEYLTAITGGIY